jgi:hypothetical protein
MTTIESAHPQNAPRAAPDAAPGGRTVGPWSGVDQGQRAVRRRDFLPGRVAPIGKQLSEVRAINLLVEVDVAPVAEQWLSCGSPVRREQASRRRSRPAKPIRSAPPWTPSLSVRLVGFARIGIGGSPGIRSADHEHRGIFVHGHPVAEPFTRDGAVDRGRERVRTMSLSPVDANAAVARTATPVRTTIVPVIGGCAPGVTHCRAEVLPLRRQAVTGRWLRDIEAMRLGTPVRPPRRVYCRGQRVLGQPKRTTAHRAFVECSK